MPLAITSTTSPSTLLEKKMLLTIENATGIQERDWPSSEDATGHHLKMPLAIISQGKDGVCIRANLFCCKKQHGIRIVAWVGRQLARCRIKYQLGSRTKQASALSAAPFAIPSLSLVAQQPLAQIDRRERASIFVFLHQGYPRNRWLPKGN